MCLHLHMVEYSKHHYSEDDMLGGKQTMKRNSGASKGVFPVLRVHESGVEVPLWHGLATRVGVSVRPNLSALIATVRIYD